MTLPEAARRLSPRTLYSAAELAHFRALLAEQETSIFQSCQCLSVEVLRRSRPAFRMGNAPERSAPDSSGEDPSGTFLSRAEAELREIAQAHERMDQGSYGRCEGCDQPIPVPRLEATPAASTCVGCRSKP